MLYRYDREKRILVECKKPVAVRHGSPWPMVCVASGVHASKSSELRDFLQKSGVPTEVTQDGDPVYTSASHRKNALKVRGLFDRTAFC